MGDDGGFPPSPCLRDFIPQTPFFASRLNKVYSAFSFFAFSSASSTCSASQLVRP